MKVEIQRASFGDVRDIAVLTGEFRAEMALLSGYGAPGFQAVLQERLISGFLENEDYAVLVARSVRGHPLGYLTVFESQPYFDDPYGVIEQIFVRPFYRRRRIAQKLLSEARRVAEAKRWRRLLVTLPFSFRLEAAALFFDKQGFSNSGQRKLWLLI